MVKPKASSLKTLAVPADETYRYQVKIQLHVCQEEVVEDVVGDPPDSRNKSDH